MSSKLVVVTRGRRLGKTTGYILHLNERIVELEEAIRRIHEQTNMRSESYVRAIHDICDEVLPHPKGEERR